ncbi:trypsin family [Volvox carteri f. nagariensis]|uniref:Trypsin family n=1 Tax=Volvox carteri f. nagariensis TaxID=3068 RepID=D8TIY9_VOLCA|nr:trypsin family [Volvox carteri f. nagariensis]EFJ52282.1 trypsin family [Volvox carteri f. nagariensis]|eukprot:XP_002946355.1 trypsin family [Volvox carteri f. nagariensis]
MPTNNNSSSAAVNGGAPKSQNAKDSSASHLDKALRSVVKIFCTSANPNYSLPWQMMTQTKSTASGFVVAPLSSRRILTNAHAVANQVQVMLRKHGNARKYPARVLAVGHECDIAMLTVDDDEFWEGNGGVEALQVGGLPPMQESVTVVGFPQGGDNVCVTKGVASRLDRQQYSHGRCALLTVQTDAPINSGNSGGPVLQGDQVVGLAFQSLVGAENTGYVIPTPVVHHFLNDLDRHGGKYTGFPEMGISWQCLESADMKRSLGMPEGATGVYITGTEPVYDSTKVLRSGDVLTSVDGHQIADDGTFLFPDQSVRIDFRHLPSMAYDGDSLRVGIWRDGAALELPLLVNVPRHLVPTHCHDLKPKQVVGERYYIFAGLVFTRLTNFYLRHQYGTDWSTKAPIKLCDRYLSGSMEALGQEVVLLSKVLSASVNQGFQEIQNVQVYKVNGVKVHNLAHMARLVEECDSEYIRFDLEWKRVVVLHTGRGRSATPDILRTNCIPAAASDGLLEEDLQLPPDVMQLSQPSMADSEVVEEQEAVPVGERMAKL